VLLTIDQSQSLVIAAGTQWQSQLSKKNYQIYISDLILYKGINFAVCHLVDFEHTPWIRLAQPAVQAQKASSLLTQMIDGFE